MGDNDNDNHGISASGPHPPPQSQLVPTHLEISVAEAVGVAVANREEHLPHQLAAPFLRVVALRRKKHPATTGDAATSDTRFDESWRFYPTPLHTRTHATTLLCTA